MIDGRVCIYCIPRKYNVPLIITSLTSARNSLKFVVVNVLRYAHAHVKHVLHSKNRYHKRDVKVAGLIKSLNITDAILSGFTVLNICMKERNKAKQMHTSKAEQKPTSPALYQLNH